MSTDEINKEILFIVKKHQDTIKQHVVAKKACDAQLKKLLNCEYHTDIDAKKSYLDAHKDTICRLKEESDNLFSAIYERRMQLFNSSSMLSLDFKNSAIALRDSKKCTCDTVNVEDFLSEEEPLELSMFCCANKPAIFRIESFSYCVFEDVILVFDKKGCFSTALDTSALKIAVKRKHADHKWHENIGEDSRAVTFKQTRNYWSYDVSGFEYGVITIVVGNTQTTFTVNSSFALDAWKNLAPKFKKKRNTMHDPIPSLLLLIKMMYHHSVSEKMLSVYEDTTQYRNKFCGIK